MLSEHFSIFSDSSWKAHINPVITASFQNNWYVGVIAPRVCGRLWLEYRSVRMQNTALWKISVNKLPKTFIFIKQVVCPEHWIWAHITQTRSRSFCCHRSLPCRCNLRPQMCSNHWVSSGGLKWSSQTYLRVYHTSSNIRTSLFVILFSNALGCTQEPQISHF